MEKFKIDPADALHAAETLNSVLFLDVPKGTLCGIDMHVYTIDGNFKGIKMIPNGLHFFSTSSTNHDHGVAPPVSWFTFLDQSQVLIRRWSATNEWLEPIRDEDEEHRFQLGVSKFEFDANLAPYDLPSWRQWRKLSNWINQKTINRIMDSAEFILIPEEGVEDLLKTIPSEAALIDQLKIDAKQCGPKLQYTKFPNLIKKSGLTVSELTSVNFDMTESLKEILKQMYCDDYTDLLAELQFCFIAFLFGQSLLSLEQWKLMIHFLFRCYDGLTDKGLETLFVDSKTLRLTDLFHDISRWRRNQRFNEHELSKIRSHSVFAFSKMKN
eukprot:g6365.t1